MRQDRRDKVPDSLLAVRKDTPPRRKVGDWETWCRGLPQCLASGSCCAVLVAVRARLLAASQHAPTVATAMACARASRELGGALAALDLDRSRPRR